MNSIVEDPGKILKLLALTDSSQAENDPGSLMEGSEERATSPDGDLGGEGAPLAVGEGDMIDLMRLLGQMGQMASQPGSEAAATQFQGQLSNLTKSSKTLLRETFVGLSKEDFGAGQNKATLLRAAEHLAIRCALDRFKRGDTKVDAVGELLERLGHEVATLRGQLEQRADPPGGSDPSMATPQEPPMGDLNHQFWTSVPLEALIATLCSPEAWRVPIEIVSRTIEQVSQSDSQQAGQVLENYSTMVAHPTPAVRRTISLGLGELADSYALSYEEVLDTALNQLETQLNRESQTELQEMLTGTYLHLRERAAAIAPLKAGEAKLVCDAKCGGERLLPLHRPFVDSDHGYRVRLYCSKCGVVTKWNSLQPDRREMDYELRAAPGKVEEEKGAGAERRAGEDRRRSRRVHVKLPIQVLWETPSVTITEVGKTLDVSHNGVFFLSSQEFPVGEEISVLVPYDEGQEIPAVRARVIRTTRVEELHGIALDFIAS